jgi:hypothetical protein
MPLAARARSQADTLPARCVARFLSGNCVRSYFCRVAALTCTLAWLAALARALAVHKPPPYVPSSISTRTPMLLSTKTSSDPLRITQIHLRRALGPARASWPPDRGAACAPNPGAQLETIRPRPACLVPTIVSLYPHHIRQLRILGSAGSLHILAVLPPLDRRCHGRICARSGCMRSAVRRGSGGTSRGARGAESRRLGPTEVLGRRNVDHRT